MYRIIARNISKKFRIGHGDAINSCYFTQFKTRLSGIEPKKDLWALRGVSLLVAPKEIIGIIGENGAGKTTLLSICAGLYRPDNGELNVDGKVVSLIGLGGGLHDRLSMKDNTYLTGALFGLKRRYVTEHLGDIARFAGLERYIDTKLYQFSDGMKGRLTFSIAIHTNPDILLLDEVTSNMDQLFFERCVLEVKKLASKGASILIASHDLSVIEQCTRSIELRHGSLVSEGPSRKIIKSYLCRQ